MERNNSNITKLVSKQEVFGLVVQTLENIKHVGYKWVFVEKRNENDKILIRYKKQVT